MDFRRLNIKSIPTSIARQLVSEWHYSKVMPKLTKQCYGGFIDGRLLAVITLGWGVRPFHTINKLFPGLDTKDYWEIGKMCLHDGLPRNSESYFMSRVFKLVKKTYPEKKLIYTWADGIMGKPGYVYQAANFLYGGYIWTDTYMTSKGEKIHPRTSQAIINRFSDTGKQARPTWKQINELDIRHVRGKQFRYCLFLRDKLYSNETQRVKRNV